MHLSSDQFGTISSVYSDPTMSRMLMDPVPKGILLHFDCFGPLKVLLTGRLKLDTGDIPDLASPPFPHRSQ